MSKSKAPTLDDAYGQLGIARSIKLPCLTCNTTTRFDAHTLDSEDMVVVFRCVECGRRAMVEL